MPKTDKELWRISLGGAMAANSITYTVNGKQMVTTSAGSGPLYLYTAVTPLAYLQRCNRLIG
jgi:hypothetical protein